MANERMMQAIGTLEAAVARLEQEVDDLARARPVPPSIGMDPVAARAALQSLDTLIKELGGAKGG